MTPLILRANIHCVKGSVDEAEFYVGGTKRHLALRIQDNLSAKSGVHMQIRSHKDCHTCTVNNLYVFFQAN